MNTGLHGFYNRRARKEFLLRFLAWFKQHRFWVTLICGFVTVHGENIPILGFMGDLSEYLVKIAKKSLTKLQKIVLIKIR